MYICVYLNIYKREKTNNMILIQRKMKNSKQYLIFKEIREKTYSNEYDEYDEYDEYKEYDDIKYTIWNIYEKQNIFYIFYV